MTAGSWSGNPAFGVAATLAAYGAAMALRSRIKWAHPLVTTCAVLLGLLHFLHIPDQNYQSGGGIISALLGPATVALGVPMYKNAARLRRSLRPLCCAVLAGAFTGMVTAALTAAALGAPRQLVMSALPKSVTTPIAIEVARQLRGLPELAAAMAVLAGLIGSIIGPPLLRRAGISNDLAIGAAMGTSAHGIATARLARESELQASTASFAMALAGIATSILAAPLVWFCR